jgi:hypothetical protein
MFGSPNEWKRIARANGLLEAAVPAGTVLLVPKASPGDGC